MGPEGEPRLAIPQMMTLSNRSYNQTQLRSTSIRFKLTSIVTIGKFLLFPINFELLILEQIDNL